MFVSEFNSGEPSGSSLIGFLGIDYDEFHPDSFRAVTAEVRNPSNDLVATESFPTIGEAQVYAMRHGAERIMWLSSIDNFRSDGGELPL